MPCYSSFFYCILGKLALYRKFVLFFVLVFSASKIGSVFGCWRWLEYILKAFGIWNWFGKSLGYFVCKQTMWCLLLQAIPTILVHQLCLVAIFPNLHQNDSGMEPKEYAERQGNTLNDGPCIETKEAKLKTEWESNVIWYPRCIIIYCSL